MKIALKFPGGYEVAPPPNFKTQFTDLGSVVSGFLEIALFVAGFLFALWLTWGVFKYLTAEGNKEDLVKARNHMRWALVGFIVVLLAFSISRYIQNIIPTL